MKIVIIEDEKFAANYLEKMILKYDPEINVMAKLESVEEAVNWFRNNHDPDLIFLDIHLDDGLSFSIFEKVNIKIPIIFTTAFDEYAIRAFKLKSIDYLLKPIMQEDLNQAIEKYKGWKLSDQTTIDINSLYALINKNAMPFKDRFSVSVGQKIKTIKTEDIAYFYSESGITLMVTTEKGQYNIDYSLDELTKQLNPGDFFRINRQLVVRLNAIKNVHVYPKSRLKIELNPSFSKEVFVTIDKVTKFKEWLGA